MEEMLTTVALRAVAMCALLCVAGCSAPPVWSASASRTGLHDRCAATRSRTVVADRQVRIYVKNGSVFGCVRANGRRAMLGYTNAAQYCFPDTCSVGPFSLAGALVAYGVDLHGRFGLHDRVVVKNLVRPRTLLDIPDGSFHPEDAQACGDGDPLIGIGPVFAIVLRRDGATAWIAQRLCDSRYITSYEVHAASRSSPDRLLDASPDIAPTSLRLSGVAATWQDGAVLQRAPL
jgi:hypothetical protein